MNPHRVSCTTLIATLVVLLCLDVAVAMPLGQGVIKEAVQAVRDGDAGTVERMLAEYPELLNCTVPDSCFQAGLLVCSIEQDQNGIARLLIAKGADLDSPDHRLGYTPLYHAAYRGGTETARLLLAAGARPDGARAPGTDTPLSVAANHGHTDVVELLVASGAAVDDIGVAAAAGLYEKVESLLKADPKLANLRIDTHSGQYGRTPLFYAADNNRVAVAKLLIEYGAAIRVTDDFRRTPLHLAARASRDVAALLLAKGADVNARDKRGDTPLHYAAWEVWQSPLIWSRANWQADEPHQSAEDSTRTAEMLIAAGAKVGARDEIGCAPLHFAAYWNAEMVYLLLAHGSDINAKDELGCTPLREAVTSPSPGTVELLIAKGADVRARDTWRRTPLHYLWGLDARLVQMLIVRGADVRAEDRDRITPLHMAAALGDAEIAELLIAHGAEIDAQAFDTILVKGKEHRGLTLGSLFDDLVRSVIVGAIFKMPGGSADLASSLRSRNIASARTLASVYLIPTVTSDQEMTDESIVEKKVLGSTPLHVAVAAGHLDLVRLLVAHGANVTAHDGLGRTPLTIANTLGLADIAALLKEHGGHE